MTSRQAAIAVAVLLLGVLVALWLRRPAPPADSAPRTAEADTPAVEAEGDGVGLQLFFPGGGGWLVVEERSIEADGSGPDLRAIVEQVLAGPTARGLYPPFPADTRVGGVFLSPSGIAYVDLTSTEANPPRSGSRDEMLSVYSLVNSIHANLPELTGVVLLWNGQQRPTFAGHLDTGRPLKANRSIVARR